MPYNRLACPSIEPIRLIGAQSMDFIEIVKSFGGWLTSFLFGGLLLRLKFKKAGLEDTSIALESLRLICDRNESEISMLRTRLHETDAMLDKERRERREAEDKHYDEMAAMRDEIAGLKRIIIQNSYSSVQSIDSGKSRA